MKSIVRVIKRTLVWLAIFVAYVALLNLLGITCPIKYLLGIRCPTCGVSRALTSLLKFDFGGYIESNPFAIPLVFAVWLLLNASDFQKKRLSTSVAFLILCANLVYFICTF